MWETTFPRLTHAGLGKHANEDNILRSRLSVAWVFIDVLIYVFPTHFRPRAESATFCSPQCMQAPLTRLASMPL